MKPCNNFYCGLDRDELEDYLTITTNDGRKGIGLLYRDASSLAIVVFDVDPADESADMLGSTKKFPQVAIEGSVIDMLYHASVCFAEDGVKKTPLMTLFFRMLLHAYEPECCGECEGECDL